MEIDITELKRIADKLFEHLQETGHQAVSVDHDYYWDVTQDTRYNPYLEPTDLTLGLGQITNDLCELRRIGDGKAEPISYALVWLSAVIRAIGEKVVA